MGRVIRVLAVLFALVLACDGSSVLPEAPSEPSPDLVLRGGRVMDPETGLDGIRDVAITGGRIVAISEGPLDGSEIVDVSGRVVAPGFVDIHSHAQSPLGQEIQARDGVTMALELESGSFPVSALGTHPPLDFSDNARLHFGASVGHAWLRGRILMGETAPSSITDALARALNGQETSLLDGSGFQRELNPAQIEVLRAGLHEGLDQGGLGIGFLLDYMSEAVSDAEMRAVFEVAAERAAPVFVHVRRGVAGDPSGLIEVIDWARRTGAPVHICHVQANSMSAIEEFLALIRKARADGIQISTESFPYNAGSTAITAAVFSRDWQKIFDISHEDVQWAETGEFLTEKTWNEYREKSPQGAVIHHYNKEKWTRVASLAPDVIVASDAMPAYSRQVKVPPFMAGTFSRILGRYVREQRALALMTALAKMTWLPIRVLEGWAPDLKRKGRVQVGADADLTIFDPTTVVDHATFAEPFLPPDGIDYVLVSGVFVVRDGALMDSSSPGQRVLVRRTEP